MVLSITQIESEKSKLVALDEDGTEIDDDEILLEISKLSLSAKILVLLPENSSWQPLAKNSAAANSIDKESTSTNVTADRVDRSPSPLQQERLGGNIWNKFPKRLMDCCNSGQRAFDADRRTMIASIADYMTQDLKDFSRGTAEDIAKIIVQKYPKTFSDVISNEVVGSGLDSLQQQIYNAVNYRKLDKETKRRAAIRLSDETATDDLDPEPSKPRKQDKYGCTDYQPLLPATESATSQTEKKLQLIQFYELKANDDKKISTLMDDTYPTQRVNINKKTRNLVQLFQDWPYLQMPKYLIDHASRLLGKSIQTVWEESLVMNVKPLRQYVVYTEKSKIIRLRQSKNSTETEPSTLESDVLKLISEAKASSKASQSDVALTAVMFPLIAKQLQEDPQYFFRVIPEDVENTDLVDFAKQESPILIIRGKSLFDDNAKCDVVLEGKTIVSARGVLDGFLITFLTYYIFGYVYPPEIHKTLEFIQRALLQINPKTGTKRKEKKRKSLPFDAAVMKLVNALEGFKDI